MSVPGTAVVGLESGCSEEGINSAVKSEAQFDIVIYHCGASNPEYEFFVQHDRSCAPPPDSRFKFYSGGSDFVAAADTHIIGDPDACAVSTGRLEANLPVFLSAFEREA